MAKVGFSTGCLHKTNINLDDRIKLLYSVGADAIELSFSSLPELMAFKLSPQLASYLSKFSHVSIHAPWHMTYNKDYYTSIILRKLADISKDMNLSGIVIHPDTIRDYSILTDFDIPFLFENMDARKGSGRFPADFEVLKKQYNCGFVFDVFHAYENGLSSEESERFIEILGNRLNHLHVSGINGNIKHSPSYSADNVQQIISTIKLANNVPRISEGVIMGDIKNNLVRELRFLRSFG